VALNPQDVPARFFLAQAMVQAGKRAEGAAAMTQLAQSMPEGDPRRARIEEEAKVAAGASVVADAAAGAPTEGAAQAAFIQSMVDRLAARLKTQPDDVDGWARLVRAYGVLKNTQAQDAALAQARKQFANRPADLAKVEAEAPKR
jgi:cytochrome c-type biogenesis protein CcmH